MPCGYRGQKVSDPLAVELQTAGSPCICRELNLSPLPKAAGVWDAGVINTSGQQKRLSKVHFFVSSYKPNSVCNKAGDLGLEMKLNQRLIAGSPR